MIPRAPGLLILLGVAILVAGAENPPGVSTSASTADLESELQRAEDLWDEGRPDSSLIAYEALLARAREEGEPSFLLRALRKAGSRRRLSGNAADAETLLQESVQLAEAVADTGEMARSVFGLALAVDKQGRPPRVVPLFERAIELSRACDLPEYEARASVRLAGHDLRAGDFESARSRIEFGLETFRRHESESDTYSALLMLGLLHARTGQADSARVCWEETLVWSRSANLSLYGSCANNLGRLDLSAGYPDRAAEWWRDAWKTLRDAGRMRAASTPAQNAALALRAIGRHEEAVEILEEQLALAREHGYADHETSALVNLGEVEWKRGRHAKAARRFREARTALRGSGNHETEANAAMGLSQALSGMDSTGAATSLMLEVSATHRDHVDFEKQTQIDRLLGEALTREGRFEEAMTVLDRSVALSREMNYPRELLRGLVLVAHAYRGADDSDRARDALIEAASRWEDQRALLTDPEWREQRGARGARIFTELADLLMAAPESGEPASEAVREDVYSRLQRYKARTLLERLTGPDGGPPDSTAPMPAPVTLGELREERLRPGELVLDFYVGPFHSFLFVVTTEQVRVVRLPGESSGLLEAPLLWRELAATPPGADARSTEEALAISGRALTERLLGNTLEDIEPDGRIFVIPDGPLHLLNLGALAPDDRPVLERCEVVHLPSSAFLARRRTDGSEDRPASGSVLAVAGRTGPRGRELEGTVREVRSLGRRFRDVDVRVDSRGPDAVRVDELSGYGVLHFAAHTSIDDQRPWNSGLRLGGEEEILRASTIASLELSTRIAVLSGCESAGGPLVTGEGALGLTSAFLCAGVPTVVATLWPVDDRVTPRLMGEFYARLARGHTAAAALREAQLELRRDPETRHPFYWAGFVLVGDGDLVVELSPRRRPAVVPAVVGLVGATLGIGLWRRRSRGSGASA